MITRRTLMNRVNSTIALGTFLSGCGSSSATVATPSPGSTMRNLLLELPLNEGKGDTVSDFSARKGKHKVLNAQASGLYGRPMGPSWKSGKAIGSSSLRFDGYSTLLRLPSLPANSLQQGVSASAWIAPFAFEWGDAPDRPRLSALLSQIHLEQAIGFAFGVYRHGTWGVSMGDGLNMRDLLVTRDASRVRRNTWSHIAFTYDRATGRASFYKDGTEVLRGQVTMGNIAMPNLDLLIGRHSQALGIGDLFKFNSYAGLTNHIRLHDYALSEAQLADLIAVDLTTMGGKVPTLEFNDIDIGANYLSTDRHRPAFHAQPNFGWMNEPHAPIFFKGKYHLFFQKNPFGPFWHQIHWGHWVSDDLIRWHEVDIALAPTDGGQVTQDIRPTSPSYAGVVAPDGIWSGSATYDLDGNPILIFTAGNDSRSPTQAIGLAKPVDSDDPSLRQWNIHPTAVITQTPGLGTLGDFRDPFVFYDETVRKYFALVTSGTPKSGTALVYESNDLLQWDYRGPLFESDRTRFPQTGSIWELPVLLPIGSNSAGEARWGFFINAHGQGAKLDVYYWVGVWDPISGKFISDSEGPRVFDCGEGYFTGPSGFVDPQSGRSILFSIAQGARSSKFDYDSGWAHSAGMPLEVSLGPDGDLHVRPIEEVKTLRGAALFSGANLTLEATNAALKAISGLQLDIEVEVAAGNRIGISGRVHPDGREHTDVLYDPELTRFSVNRDRATLKPSQSDNTNRGGSVRLNGASTHLRMLVDGSLIETYLGEKYSLTTRAYPDSPEAAGVALIGNPDLLIMRVAVYPINPIVRS